MARQYGSPRQPRVTFHADMFWDSRFLDLGDRLLLRWVRELCRAEKNSTRVAPRNAFTRKEADTLIAGGFAEADGKYFLKLLNVTTRSGGAEVAAFVLRHESERSDAHYPEVLERDGARCRYCGSAKHPTIDHVVPKSRGGSDEPANLVVACRSCNARKGDRTPGEASMVILPILVRR